MVESTLVLLCAISQLSEGYSANFCVLYIFSFLQSSILFFMFLKFLKNINQGENYFHYRRPALSKVLHYKSSFALTINKLKLFLHICMKFWT